MSAHLARLALLIGVVALVLMLLKPDTRKRLHKQITLFATLLLISSVAMAAWQLWRSR
ncbi:hypothetical protein [Chitinimonas sp. BJYL2]|uniref:protein MIGRI n=1 Tax=Chitinimonas sp. BJYL2 TaxID=2976696 RepID=UPI0022B3B71F|nr:hypothetical protein [Chitinimonas sp. BJYL2]